MMIRVIYGEPPWNYGRQRNRKNSKKQPTKTAPWAENMAANGSGIGSLIAAAFLAGVIAGAFLIGLLAAGRSNE